MGASYPEGHIPQDVYEKMMEEKRARDRRILAKREKTIIHKLKERTKAQKTSEKKEPEIKDVVVNKEIEVMSEAKLWKLKYREQVDLLKKLGGYNTYEIRKKFRYEKDRVKELLRLYKSL